MADKRDARSALRAYEEPSALQGAWDEIAGAFARYGRRSGAQRDASLAMLNQAVDPNTDPLTGAGMKALGLAGLVTHPLAFFPTGDEWRERLANAGNTSRLGQSIGGMLGDLPSVVDPHLLAGGGALAMAPIAAKMMNKADDVADAGIVAYHGSPHSFDKFDMSKIGTGEGNQAYMRGLYFAENEGVAKEYRDKLAEDIYQTDSGPMFNPSDLQHLNVRSAARTDIDAAIQKAEAVIAAPTSQQALDAAKADLMKLQDAKSRGAKRDAGSLYQVLIDAKPEEFLDWDIPLSQQPKGVAEALRGLDHKLFETDTWASKLDGAKTKGRTVSYGPDNRTGEAAARAFEENFGGPEIAAEKLKAAGIKGVRYKDSGSRGGKGDTYNYVVFDDSLITILKKYGIPMTAGAGGAMMVAGQDMPPEFAAQMGGT